jgi:glutathione-independent formaldehyde dehydrogenase
MLSDIFLTGYHATELAGVQTGKTAGIYSAGAVGLMAAYSAKIKGADKIIMVDTHKIVLA